MKNFQEDPEQVSKDLTTVSQVTSGGTPPVSIEKLEENLSNNAFEGAVKGLASTNTRNLGGEVGAKLISAMTSQFTTEIYELKKKVSELEMAKEKLSNEIGDLKSNNSIIRTENLMYRKLGNAKTLITFFGTAFLGFGLDKVSKEYSVFNWFLLLSGIVLIVLAFWLKPSSINDSNSN